MIRKAGLILLLHIAFVLSPVRAQEQIGLAKVELTLVDSAATGYGVFQSHNQKVASNDNGIFMTHLRSHNENYTAQQWRLSQSVDGGQSFATIYQATDATYPPALETDENNDIFLVRTDFEDGNAYFYRFLAEENYARVHRSTLWKGSAQKFTMVYDQPRRQFYYMTWEGGFYIIDLSKSIYGRKAKLLKDGDHAVPMYPHLFLDPSGALHYAWTTQKHGVYLYWDIHYMMSPDVGEHWQKLDGSPLPIRIKCDDSGPSDRITLDDEFDVHTWLSNQYVKDGKLHFLYEAQFAPWPYRQHYVRYDLDTGRRDVDIFPEFRGEQISLMGLDGFFTAQRGLENAPLYAIGNFGGRIGCLASDDNGDTWYDYAVADTAFLLYSIGGCRTTTRDHFIIGSFVNQRTSPQGEDQSQVYFLKIKAGLSQAKIARARYRDGRLSVDFSEFRGQPQFIRFRADGAEWSEWAPFAAHVEHASESMPTEFQLKSRMGVTSHTFHIDYATAVARRFARSGDNATFRIGNYPNPFNAETVIEINLAEPGPLSLEIFDSTGRRVRRLWDGPLASGAHRIRWDGRDQVGRQVSGGVYWCCARTASKRRIQKIVLLR